MGSKNRVCGKRVARYNERMTTYERIEKVIRYIEAHREEQPSLDTLAKVAGLSPFHFQRLFSKWAGVTPKDFVKAITNEHAKALLEKSRGVLEASFESGLSGPGRLHDLLVTVEGVTPGEFKARGAGVAISYGFHDTPFGECLIGATKRGVCYLAFGAKLADLRKRWPRARLERDQDATRKLVDAMFSRRKSGKIRLVLDGTPFQVPVWKALLRIPRGRLASYHDIARAIGKPKADRAVGAAVGGNAIGYLIPCHRVIRASGAVGDYRWGAPRKRALLAWESAL